MKIISLKSDAPGKYSVDLDETSVELHTRYNYLAACWAMDIADVTGATILNGIMLVPGVDLLKGHPEHKPSLGAIVVVEKFRGDYQSPGLLGTNTKVLWYAPGEEVIIPI